MNQETDFDKIPHYQLYFKVKDVAKKLEESGNKEAADMLMYFVKKQEYLTTEQWIGGMFMSYEYQRQKSKGIKGWLKKRLEKRKLKGILNAALTQLKRIRFQENKEYSAKSKEELLGK